MGKTSAACITSCNNELYKMCAAYCPCVIKKILHHYEIFTDSYMQFPIRKLLTHDGH